MRFINIQELKEGMILLQDIIGKYELVFLTRGTILTEEHIERIQNMEIRYVYVDEKDEEPIGKEADDRFHVKIDAQLTEQYTKSLSAFKTVYKEVSLGKKIESEIIRNAISPLMEEIMTDNNILGRLRSVENVDDYTYKHSIDVCILSTMIGKWLGYSGDDLNNLSIAGVLHDIGKSKIPTEILNKPGKLSLDEYNVMKTHATLGYEMLQDQDEINFDICCGVFQHHERMDGSGYPSGLRGDEIHEFARIIAVADIFDAMTSQRIYKSKQSPFEVAELIAKNRFGILDPYVSNKFLWQISKFYVGNIVKLNTGEIGEIILINKQIPTRPFVKVGNRFIDLNKSNEYKIMDVLAKESGQVS
ncbi:HD-GYP domain-containing protein [Marinisporobacter balticus]|uniref:Putative nucleotidyltransferase with HDIG domain n=1 Tax=Marinisporobacter balticus TaxID=2018667 RepID=A0A4R2K9W2_9FIRM|nr:HD-GYP domain-containing protein [Marinisporobacter balticus]TCO70213.1 putative nucleotidyltransferase with HDIG domain [Marinisporobacter balticus]